MSPALVVDDVTIRRGRRSVLAGVSLTATAGEIVAVIGPNGAGKTSLLQAILGLLPIARGTVSYGGRPLQSLRARAAVFSYLPEDAEPPAEVRVATLLRCARVAGRVDERAAEALADRLGVRGLATAFAGELSRGERRRVLLAAALSNDRPVIVLDEPLGVFDPLQLIEVRALLRARATGGTALLISVHQMAEAERIAARLVLLDDGRRLACGSLAELREQAGRPGAPLEDVFLALLRQGHAPPAA
jgi:ABC-type multidrug transport system ATPase subunit